MPAAVNKRFVVLIVAGVVVACVGAAVLYSVVTKSGEEYEVMGDEAAAEGRWQAAAGFYGRAVSHDRGNEVWLNKLREASERMAPPTRLQYNEAVNEKLVPSYAALAQLNPDSFEDVDRLMSFQTDRALLAGFSEPQYAGILPLLNTELERAEFGGMNATDFDRLRRHRGRVHLWALQGGARIDGSEIPEGRGDLEAALAADPADAESAIALATWPLVMLQRNARQSTPEQIDAAFDESLSVLAAAREAAQAAGDELGQARVDVVRLRLEMQRWIRELAQTQGEPDTEAREARVAELRDRLDRVASVFDDSAGQLTHEDLQRLQSAESLIDAPARFARTMGVAASAAGVENPDPFVVHIAGALAQQRGQIAESIGLSEQLVNADIRPLSVSGLLQFGLVTSSLQRLVSLHLSLAQDPQLSEAEREAALEAADEARARFADRVLAEDLRLLRVDGEIALVRNRPRDALRFLQQYNRQTNAADVEGRLLEARAASRVPGQQGRALELYRGLMSSTRVRWNSLDASVFVELLRRAGDVAAAEAVAERFAAMMPEGSEARARFEQFTEAIGETSELQAAIASASDPSAQFSAVLRTLQPDDYDAATLQRVANIAAQAGRIEDLRVLLDRIGTAQPDNTELTAAITSIRDQLGEASDRLSFQLAAAERAESPAARHLIRHRAYLAAGMPEEAEAELQAAEATNPTDAFARAVFNSRWDSATRAGDVETLESLVSRAARENFDNAGGLEYRARLASVKAQQAENEGRSGEAESLFREAAELAERAIERDIESESRLRLLATARQSLRQTDLALEALQRLLALQPGDVGIALQYVQQLIQAGRMPEALATSDDLVQRFEQQAAARNAWVQVRLQAGDENSLVQAAVRANDWLQRFGTDADRRLLGRTLIEIAGTDTETRNELAPVLGRQPALAAAGRVLQPLAERLEDAGDVSPDDVALLAELYLASGNPSAPNASLQLAQQFAQLGSATDTARAASWLNVAVRLANAGAIREAVQAASRAAALDTPLRANSLLAAAELRGSVGDLAGARAVLRNAIEADQGTPNARLERTLVRLEAAAGRANSAAAMLESLPQPSEESSPSLTAENAQLRADVALAQRRFDDARDLYTQALAAQPERDDLYLARAEASLAEVRASTGTENAKNAPDVEDALANAKVDLDTALEAKPQIARARRLTPDQIATAHRLMAEVLKRQGGPNAIVDAAAVLMQAPLDTLQPSEAARMLFLFADTGEAGNRQTERLALAMVRAQPDNAGIAQLSTAAVRGTLDEADDDETVVDEDRAEAAVTLLEAVAANATRAGIGALNAAARRALPLSETHPQSRLDQVTEAYRGFGQRNPRVQNDPRWPLAQIHLRLAAAGETLPTREVAVLLDQAANTAGEASVGQVFQRFDAMLGELETRERFKDARQQFLNAIPPGTTAGGWMRLASSEPAPEVLVEAAEAQAARARDGLAGSQLALRLLAQAGGRYYEEENYEAAVQTWSRVLGTQNTPQLANNLAWTLGKHLDRAEEALPLARDAVERANGQPAFLNTLAVVQLKLGQVSEAAESVKRSEEAASLQVVQPSVLATSALVKAEIALAQGRPDDALRLLNSVEAMGLSEEDLSAVESDIESIRDRAAQTGARGG